jgi:hypothetical protein
MSATEKVNELMKTLETERFYGQLTLQYRAGAIELVRKEQTIKFEGNNPNVRNR